MQTVRILDPHARPSLRRAVRLAWSGLRHGASFGRSALPGRRAPLVQLAAHQARLAFQDMGPTFVKFGQVIASTPAFPDALTAEFKHCLDSVPPEPAGVVRATVRRELGDHVFRWVDWEPLAAGSIAQVFRAETVDGDDVVIKVQRANLRTLLRQDLGLMLWGARLALRLRPQLRVVNPVGLVEDLADSLATEIAFSNEAAAMEELRRILAPWPVRIPRVFPELCSDKVLVMERLEGTKIADLAGLDAIGVDRDRLTETIFATVLYAGCRHGVFHGDMHAGNLMVCHDDGKLGLLDFGIVGRLPGKLRVQVSELLQCLFDERWDRLAALCFEMAEQTDVDMDAAVAELTDVAGTYLGSSLAEMPIAKMAGDILQRANRFGFELPTDVLLFFKNIMYLDGLGITLNPGYEVLDAEQGQSLMRFLAPETGGAPAGEQPTYGHEHVLAAR